MPSTIEAPKRLSGADLAGFPYLYHCMLYGLMVALRSFMFLVRIRSSSGLQPKRMLFTSERLASFVTSKLSTSSSSIEICKAFATEMIVSKLVLKTPFSI